MFCNICQHGIANTNPSYQVVAALKTVAVHNISQPISAKSNCENNNCPTSDNLREFISNDFKETVQTEDACVVSKISQTIIYLKYCKYSQLFVENLKGVVYLLKASVVQQ